MFRLLFSCCLISIVWKTETVTAKSLVHGRIIGGTTARREQFPYQVSLRSGIWQSSHFCGAFIITNRWIGTAAHCTHGRSSGITAVVGAVSKSSEGSMYRINKIVDHPDYNNANLKNDIALMKTEKPIEFSLTVHPVYLGSHYVNNGTSATVSGWGYTTHPGDVASDLQWIAVQVIDNNECKNRMSESNAAKVFDSSLCAQSTDQAGGACMGDSGGPLVGPNNILIAIASWGVPCSMGYPDVYTRISYFHDWIDSVLDF